MYGECLRVSLPHTTTHTGCILINQPSLRDPSWIFGNPIFSSTSSLNRTCSKRSASWLPSSSRVGIFVGAFDPPRPLPRPRYPPPLERNDPLPRKPRLRDEPNPPRAMLCRNRLRRYRVGGRKAAERAAGLTGEIDCVASVRVLPRSRCDSFRAGLRGFPDHQAPQADTHRRPHHPDSLKVSMKLSRKLSQSHCYRPYDSNEWSNGRIDGVMMMDRLNQLRVGLLRCMLTDFDLGCLLAIDGAFPFPRTPLSSLGLWRIRKLKSTTSPNTVSTPARVGFSFEETARSAPSPNVS